MSIPAKWSAVFVVPKASGLTEESVIAHAKQSLTGYKVPKHVYIRKDLPQDERGEDPAAGVEG